MEAAAFELDDDLFFKDLSRQISLLIMDDDDNDGEPLVHCPSVNLQAFNRATHPTTQPSFLNYNQLIHNREMSKGTGVFIPQSTNPRRRNTKQGNNKFDHRVFDHASRGVSHSGYNNHHHHIHHQYQHIDHSPTNLRRF